MPEQGDDEKYLWQVRSGWHVACVYIHRLHYRTVDLARGDKGNRGRRASGRPRTPASGDRWCESHLSRGRERTMPLAAWRRDEPLADWQARHRSERESENWSGLWRGRASMSSAHRILVIEDDSAFREVLCQALECDGH